MSSERQTKKHRTNDTHDQSLVPSQTRPLPFDTMGLFTYLRTYARRHDEDDVTSTIESWSECLERVVTACNTQLKCGFSEEENKELFELLYNLKCSVAGRFLWQLGTKTVDKLGLMSLQNCLKIDTEFLTSEGVKTFQDFKDGDEVVIRGKLKWMPATVKNFGKQPLMKLSFRNAFQRIYATPNHRWLVLDGSPDSQGIILHTEDLRPGNVLLHLPEYSLKEEWIVESVQHTDLIEDVWCVVEPVEECFTLACGILTKNCSFVVVDEPIKPFTWAMNFLMLGCVPPDTPVEIQGGTILPISAIRVGDRVWSYNLDTDQRELKKVTHLHDPIVPMDMNIRLKCHHGLLTTSKKHPILVFRNRRWNYVPAGLVEVGDVLKMFPNSNGENDTVLSIETDLYIDEHWKDITVEDNNNYFCGEYARYCTHNSGVGYRILPEDVSKLPAVKYALITRKDTKDADYVVPDSREGWIKLLGKVLKAHFYSGQGFTYSCTLLRSKGAPIRSFGGVASGPDVLCDGIAKISIILNKRAGQNMRPIDALDVMNIIGQIVISGNV